MSSKNILLIIADDLGRNLGCYGEPIIQTPHIDSIATSGVKFDNSFASTASCSGSRSVIYTGLHTHENGQYGLQHTFHHFMTHDNVETLPKLFNDGGYLTGIIGKIHVGPNPIYPWTVNNESPTRDVQWVADRSKDFFNLAKEEKKPFCLTVGYMDPHRDNTRGGFANNKEYPGVEKIVYDPKDVQVPHFLSDLPAVREELAEYFQSISRMDQGVGKILKNLEEAGYREDTLVMFISDNGSPFLNSKTTLYDAGVRLPMILRVPGGPTGTTNPTMVSYIDIVPTFLEFAGIYPPHNPNAPQRRGRSVLPILAQTGDKTPSEWKEVYGSHTFHELTNYYPTRFLRTSRYKYHRNICWKLDFPFSADIYASKSWEAVRDSPSMNGEIMIGQRSLTAYIRRGAEELYDLESDPSEVKNLAKEKEYQDLVLEMRGKVEKLQRETNDPWLFRDGVSLKSMAQYIGEDGFTIQDRFDFELEKPGSNKTV